MEATIGDKICIHGNTVGHADKHGEIIEVRGDRGEPPYVVRFPDGQERTIFPGPDAYIIPRQRQSPLLPGGALVVSGRVHARTGGAGVRGVRRQRDRGFAQLS
jgi:hypothetical protein